MCFNAKTGAWQFSATANLLPGKHVFDHSVDYTERFTASASAEVDATQGNLSGTISIVNNNPTLGSFDVVISNVKAPNGVETVSVPIWSEINGQDDIIWYTANRQNNGTYTVNVKASAHKNSTGLYNVHLYYVQKDGQLTGVGGITTQVFIGKTSEQLKPKVSFAIENNNAKNGTFDAVITNITAPLGVKEVLVPTWSLEKSQDDLIWHKASKQTDGSYRVTIKASEHKGIKRNYRADAYIVDNSNNRHYIAEKVVAVDYARPSGVLTIENNNTAAGTFDAVVRNIVAPDVYKRQIQDNNIVIFMEPKALYGKKEEVTQDPDFYIPLGKGEIKREGTDLTIVTYGRMLERVLKAAEEVAEQGINVEVVDPRTLIPLDKELIFESVKKTGKLMLVNDAYKTGGFIGEIAAMVTESEAFDYLDHPIVRLASEDVPVPYARVLEQAVLPDVEKIKAAIIKMANKGN